MKKYLLFILIGLLFGPSCQSFYDAPVPETPYLKDINEIKDLSQDDLYKAFGAENYPEFAEKAMLLARSRHFRAAVITYHTVDPWGNPVIADGTVYYPLDCAIKGVLEISCVAHVHRDDGPSEHIPALESLPIVFGYAVFMPDFIGYGKYGNTKDLYHPFLMMEHLGRNVWDFRQAAITYMRTIGYKVPHKTMLTGYSYGGGVALGMAKYYQCHHPEEVTVERVVAGGGSYDLNATFQGYIRQPVCTYPLLPYTILALNHYYKAEYAPSSTYCSTMCCDRSVE